MANFKEEIARIRAFVFDVDGVFTDGRITVTPDGEFLRAYNSKDGYAVSFALRQGYKICIITGGRGKALDARFQMLGVTRLYTACMDKTVCLEEFLADNGLGAEEAIYMGDDLPDVEAMNRCGLAACPADAVPEAIEASHYVSPFRGGEGCVRDIIEQVLRARGDWLVEKGFNFVPSA
jgi:3-deoxy-D-manno-octulosonate 8-phosphate phosphatase (KDO 8-P phosphatase)